MTTNLDQLYLHMVQYLETLPEMANQLDCPEQMVQLLIRCFDAVREYFVEMAQCWDNKANSGVCCIEPRSVLELMSLPFSQ